MPRCGSQITLCDMPIRFDSYLGCSHGCTYCFTCRKRDNAQIEPAESVQRIRSFIEGKREMETNWCDFEQPLHWGGMSDPFQREAEGARGTSLEILKLLAETGYPVVFSTKSTLVVEEPYRSLMKRANLIAQVSMLGSSYDVIEPGAPTFAERLEMLPRLVEQVRRVVVRAQPFIPGMEREIIAAIPEYAEAGVYAVTVEGLKRSKKQPGYIKLGADFVRSEAELRRAFKRIKEACHSHGLVFLCAENRLRKEMSDSLACCGTADLENFGRTNTANMNHLDAAGRIEYTDWMREPGTAKVWKNLGQTTMVWRAVCQMSYADAMDLSLRTKGMREAMGLPLTETRARVSGAEELLT